MGYFIIKSQQPKDKADVQSYSERITLAFTHEDFLHSHQMEGVSLLNKF